MINTVNKYRLFCETESAYVFGWSETTPTICFNNAVHAIDTSSIVIVDSISDKSVEINNLPMSAFDEVRTVERSKVIELKSIFGKSNLRDIYTEVGGTITNNIGDSTFSLNVSGATDNVILRSAERSRYVAGIQGEVGMAVKVPLTLTGNQVIKVGLFDTNNGFYFRQSSSGVEFAILRVGVETIIPRDIWNVDKLDGTGRSGVVLDLSKGIIVRILFSWYGYGAIKFTINLTDPKTNIQTNYLAHVFQSPDALTSVANPNLPLSVSLSNNGTAATTSVQVAGRQFSVMGKYEPITRINSNIVVGRSINSLTTFIPMISIRRKAGYEGNAISKFIADFIASHDLVIQIRVGTTLTGAVFSTTYNSTAADDTAIESDTTATTVTGGIPIWTGLVDGSNTTTVSYFEGLSFNLSEFQILTLMARGVSSTNANVTSVLRWTEEW